MQKRRVVLLALSLVLACAGFVYASGASDTGASAAVPKLRLFMGNSGVPHPQGVNPSDNYYINVVKKYAGVDLEVEVPGYEDFATKSNLMLASGNLPDVVHTWIYNETSKAAEAGAFIDLKSYYDKSPVMQKVITPSMLEYTKTQSGHYFLMPMRWTPVPGWGNYARYDLIKKYNASKWPESVDEWISFLRKVKQNIPDSIPLSAHAWPNRVFAYGETLWLYYGVLPSGNASRIRGGKVVPDFTTPEFKEAVRMWRGLYNESILDKEFATNDQPKRLQRVENNDVALHTDGADQILGIAAYWADKGHKDWEFQVTPPLKVYPAVVSDPKYTNFSYMPLPVLKNSHGMYVSSSSKYKDKAWKVIEGFASQELLDAIFWGQEGVNYTVKDGKKIADPKMIGDATHTWALHLAVIWGFPTIFFSPVKLAEYESKVGTDKYKPALASLDIWARAAESNGLDRGPFLPALDDVAKKQGDSGAFMTEVTTQAIMGKISMEDFDAKVAEYKGTYQWMWDALTKQFQDSKETLRKNGVKTVDW